MPNAIRLMPGTPFPNLRLPTADGRQYLGQVEKHRSAWESKKGMVNP